MIKHYQVIYHISTTNHYDAEWWTAIGILTGYYPTIVNHYSLLLSHCILGFAIQEPPKITAIPHKKYSPRFPSGKQWARFQALACMHHYISCIHIYIYMYLHVSLWHDYQNLVMNLAFNTIIRQGSWTQTLQRAMKSQLEHIGKKSFKRLQAPMWKTLLQHTLQ